MIRHLFTLIWNRRRANMLLIAEIMLAFVILFAVGSVLVYFQRNYQAPLGFDYERVWQIRLSPGTQPEGQQFATFQQILQHLRATPGVELVARTGSNTSFSFSSSSGTIDTGPGTPTVETDYYQASAELGDVLGLQLRQGRWFNASDDAATRRPVVITEMTRAGLFPGQSPLGKVIHSGDEEWQVVGVVDTYRGTGVLSEERAGSFMYVNPQDTTSNRSTLLIRVRAGAGAALEKKINEDIRTIGPTWTSNIKTMTAMRAVQLRQMLPFPALLGVVCLFLLVNVALGLFGVLWLNISRRRAELGVRRALGATGLTISGQVLGEILVVTTFGLVLGLLVTVQFPLLGVLSVSSNVYLTAMGLATLLLYALTALCALYPSQLAARIPPAVALREE